jgi:hypothetical protein
VSSVAGNQWRRWLSARLGWKEVCIRLHDWSYGGILLFQWLPSWYGEGRSGCWLWHCSVEVDTAFSFCAVFGYRPSQFSSLISQMRSEVLEIWRPVRSIYTLNTSRVSRRPVRSIYELEVILLGGCKAGLHFKRFLDCLFSSVTWRCEQLYLRCMVCMLCGLLSYFFACLCRRIQLWLLCWCPGGSSHCKDSLFSWKHCRRGSQVRNIWSVPVAGCFQFAREYRTIKKEGNTFTVSCRIENERLLLWSRHFATRSPLAAAARNTLPRQLQTNFESFPNYCRISRDCRLLVTSLWTCESVTFFLNCPVVFWQAKSDWWLLPAMNPEAVSVQIISNSSAVVHRRGLCSTPVITFLSYCLEKFKKT